MNKKIAVVGGGIAGIEAATALNGMGYNVTLFEKENKLGGHVANWAYLFPDMQPAGEVTGKIKEKLNVNEIKIITGTQISSINKSNGQFIVNIGNENIESYDGVLIATGYDLFNADRKEEYGYGVYDNVITSADLEKMFLNGEVTKVDGNEPKRIGIIHCVGSRDEKVGNMYCSKVCCVTAVKQAIELRKMLPDSDVYCFYMDMRMYGAGFEELYREAQEKYDVQFIRGRLSETSENHDGTLLLKSEDTLAGRPLKMSVDMLVLMSGMVPRKETHDIVKILNLETRDNGFIDSDDHRISFNNTAVPGIFIAGACGSPMSIPDTVSSARSAALAVHDYFVRN